MPFTTHSQSPGQSPRLLILTGPTASGKTGVALELCDLLNGEIVSADSMLIYRGLDIATAKPSPEEQARARHHLLDIRNPDEEYSAAQWAEDAQRAIADIHRRGKQPLVVGGTGFYLKALLRPGLLAGAPPNPALRGELEELARREGIGVLHGRLQEIDAAAAARLHPNDVMRVVRAIEVAQFRADVVEEEIEEAAACEYSAFGLAMSREQLYDRINARVDAMLEAGFLQELQSLVAAGYGDTAPLQSIGYKQMRPALADPALADECIELWKRETRRYAKRQGTWFRNQLDVTWIGAKDEEGRLRGYSELAGEIAQKFLGEM